LQKYPPAGPELLEMFLRQRNNSLSRVGKDDRKGLFQLADKGTLFLDEIGDMPPVMQAKLLRVLEDGLVMPVGGTSAVRVDVRIISAANQDLAKLMEQKKFREDLYFRIKGISVTLPAIRNRRSVNPTSLQIRRNY
jgi:transcriptional regulator with PAS, ATPase and Fis domain